MNIFSRTRKGGTQDHSFDVVQAFAALDSTRKMALFDRLNGSRKTFYKTVTLLWPTASNADCKKLESFLARHIAANDA